MTFGDNSAYTYNAGLDELGTWRQNMRHAMRAVISARGADECTYNCAVSYLAYVAGQQATNASYYQFVAEQALEHLKRGSAVVENNEIPGESVISFHDEGFKFSLTLQLGKTQGREDCTEGILRCLKGICERAQDAFEPAKQILDVLGPIGDTLPFGEHSGPSKEWMKRAIAAFEATLDDDVRTNQRLIPFDSQITALYKWEDARTLRRREAPDLNLPAA
jgi:hypothetical protein